MKSDKFLSGSKIYVRFNNMYAKQTGTYAYVGAFLALESLESFSCVCPFGAWGGDCGVALSIVSV
jgi:hypothetical protein